MSEFGSRYGNGQFGTYAFGESNIKGSPQFSYGTSAFGTNAFGVDVFDLPVTAQSVVTATASKVMTGSATATVSVSTAALGGTRYFADGSSTSTSSTSAQATRVREGDANPSATASNSASANAEFTSGALSSAQSVNVSVAEQFILELSTDFDYGTSAYGRNQYGAEDLQTVVQAVSSATSTGIRIQFASASGSASSSATSDSTRVRESDGQVYGYANNTANGVYIVNIGASTSCSATVTPTVFRVREVYALKSATSVVSAIGREKWEPIPYTSTTWSKIAA